MRPILIAVLSAAACAFASAAHAEQRTVFCSGAVYYQNSGVTTPIQGHAALLNLEARSFLAPIYGPVYVTKINPRQISFWKDDRISLIVGTLNRVSGGLTMHTVHKNFSGIADPRDIRNSQMNATCTPG